jgi:hypothetical protein
MSLVSSRKKKKKEAICSTELAVLGTLSWERIDIVNCINGSAWAGMPKEEIDIVIKWIDNRISGLIKKRDNK